MLRIFLWVVAVVVAAGVVVVVVAGGGGGGGGVVCTAPVVGMSEAPQVCLGLLSNYTRTRLDNV